ncbi:phosphatidate cytidylyltransferase [Halothermothrix orenii]|uniref:Phosphatidate cytidylyltransferase n=1 Tax=Halothermothrix orenii (strain H 168 / OCM 544 / DSM 9562) TaxID=373903 RepID=B8CW59_HALOH|nr:phosphatidate cytidylyltransferase [Halothermothrix orenii]ACL69528.1 phosphatidate cytidylyltransferase [Halothermothrix orenii H 168]
MLSYRVLSAIAGIILFILFVFWGSFPYFLFVSLIAILAAFEYNRLINGDWYNKYILSFFILLPLIYTYLRIEGYNLPLGLYLYLILLIFFIINVLIYKKDSFTIKTGYNILGFVYIAGGMVFFLLLRNIDIEPFGHTKALWLALITTWITDTGAYFIGKFLGNKKLAATISPNKTVEGALGGIISSIIAVFLMTTAIGSFSPRWVLYALLMSILGITGDLFESTLKRDCNVKDSGNIIPGHGGILDRFDSLLFTVPFTYYFIMYWL